MHINSENKQIHGILISLKLGAIVLSGILILNSLIKTDSIYDYTIIFKIIIALLTIIVFSSLYYLWSFRLVYKFDINMKIALLSESIFFIFLFMFVIMFTGKNLSPFKLIFLFILIPVSIQFDSRSSTFVAVLCSLFLLSIDILYGPKNSNNGILESDIIVSVIFIITTFILSYYVKLEKEHAEALENRANLDSLTGLYNHRFFHDTIKELFEAPEPEKKVVSLIFIDIDYFKEYNDMFGHLSGDEVLKEISFILKENAGSKNTTVCRYGGDEFAIILSNKSESQTVKLAEEIRKSFEQAHFEGQEHLPSGNLTASIGIALFNDNMKSYPELIKCADDALYRAKFINKNKVEVYSSVFDMIKNDIEEEHFDLITSIKTLISVINAKDKYTYGHVERVVIYVKMFAEELDLSESSKKALIYSAYMHDIGKVNIPEVVLNKKMPLDDDEWNIMKQHPQNGAEIVNKVESLSNTAPIIKHHHERYDGKGYPDGLKGKEIPYLSRVLTISDSFDAMTFSRPYRPAMTFAQAIEELEKCSGTQFDPELAKIFIRTIKNLKADSDSYIPQNKDDYLMHHPK